ncbi:MAG: UDP-N-acetylmuramate:L-alanyl-gamma-D-glutamyl-meso-diaminopimelate ligase [Alphaproteobacteria bacterium]|nr:UDP-N-acetylmuramate:L-alanyl-gamma-D-glutamyl-meso-diaminopimelate ligase [Alphaproteobacteria bacterium]MCB9696429.1 UDP-N-acetylmuramate:L-alanyl-gamma-D-glutamyl-meso-diaminopimelate ligase [Alphaproteobacteria bacterium]
MPHVVPDPSTLRTVHVMGIAGTAMAALAGMLHDAGYEVTGSDTAIYPPMSDYLASLQIPVKTGYVASNLDHSPDLVIVGNVIRAEYEEAKAVLERDLPYCSFPEAFGALFLKDAHSVVVAGTHGKTTTTAITAWLLEAAGMQPGFLVGGIARNFDRTARRGAGEVFVVEGDEYDTAFFDKGPKFLHYRPRTVILTSVEFDHADIYRDLDHVKQSFRKLMAIVPEDGTLVVRGDDPGAMDVAADARCRVLRYGPGQDWDGEVLGVDQERGVMRFRVTDHGVEVGTFESCMVGTHNLYNQVAAAAAAIAAGAPPESLARGFATFGGIKRRQEVIGEPGGVTVIDDFAHHPTAVAVTLDALRQRFGDRRLWAIWEPRSATSRRAVFQEDYARAFGAADQVIVATPFDQSRIEEEDRFSSERLVRELQDAGVDAIELPDADTIARTVATRAMPRDVIAILSNGGFGGLHRKLLDLLDQRFS